MQIGKSPHFAIPRNSVHKNLPFRRRPPFGDFFFGHSFCCRRCFTTTSAPEQRKSFHPLSSPVSIPSPLSPPEIRLGVQAVALLACSVAPYREATPNSLVGHGFTRAGQDFSQFDSNSTDSFERCSCNLNTYLESDDRLSVLPGCIHA